MNSRVPCIVSILTQEWAPSGAHFSGSEWLLRTMGGEGEAIHDKMTAGVIREIAMSSNPRYKNGNARRKMRARFKAMGLPCAICGRPIHYDEPSDSRHPLSFVIDEIKPVGRYKEWGYKNKTEAALDWDNVQPAHWVCNAAKGSKTIKELAVAGRKQNGLSQGTRSGVTINIPDGNW